MVLCWMTFGNHPQVAESPKWAHHQTIRPLRTEGDSDASLTDFRDFDIAHKNLPALAESPQVDPVDHQEG